MTGSGTVESTLPEEFPSHVVGLISPRGQSDTGMYEFYKIAPPKVIATHKQLGLGGFSVEAVQRCLEENLGRCVSGLLARQAEVVILGGIPIELYISSHWRNAFESMASAARFGGRTSWQAARAAFAALGAHQIGVVNKWTVEMNQMLSKVCARAGLELVSVSNSAIGISNFDRDFQSGALLALRLIENLMASTRSLDCIWLAGGAWLTSPIVAEIEEEFGIPVVTGLQAQPWYCMNVLECYVPIQGRGRLLTLCPDRLAP